MSYKSLFLTIGLVILTNNCCAQPGFNKIYSQYSLVDNFSRLIADKDTLFCFGIAYDTTILASPTQVLMVKLDTLGNIIQSKLYKDSLNAFFSMDFTNGNIIKTKRGFFAFPVAVFGRSSIQIMQVDSLLQVQSAFEYSVGDNYSEFYKQILEMPDGGFMVAGSAQRPNLRQDGFVRRVDKNGNVVWFKYFGGYNTDEGVYAVYPIHANRFLLGGSVGPNFTDIYGARAGLWVIDSNGVVLDTWTGPAEPNLLSILGILPTSDGGYIAHGRTYWGEGTWGSKVQVSLMKFDSTLQLQWIKHIGPATSNYNAIFDMIPTPDGHFLVAGERTAYGNPVAPSEDWGGWMYKFTEQGDSLWSRADNAPPGYDATGEFVYGGVGVLSSGSIVAGGRGDIEDRFVGWVVKVSADGCMDSLLCQTSSLGEPTAPAEGILVFPNPASEFVHIQMPPFQEQERELVLYDLAGRKVLNQKLLPGNQDFRLSLSAYPSGWYLLLILENGRQIYRTTLALIR